MKTEFLSTLVLAFLTTSALSGEPPASRSACSGCCSAKADVAAPDTKGTSLYQLEAVWTNDLGQAVKLGALKGKPQVILMFFASCPYACPLLVEQVKQIEAGLPEAVRQQVGFSLVSFDSDRDTPQVLAAYRAQHQLPSGRWTLLRGDADAVLDLAALLGVKFKKETGGGFAHSNLITLLNADGEIVYQRAGLNGDGQEMVRHIEQLVAPEPCRH